MKSYINITGKYLRTQKKRSVLTVVGIILSVALVTGIGTIFLSMFDANLRYTISTSGDYYAAVNRVPGDKVALLTENAQTSNGGVGQFAGFAAYSQNEKNEVDTPYKYLSIMALDGDGQKMLPYALEDGRMPEAAGEITVDNWTLKYLNAKIGDKISLDIGTRALDGNELTDTKVSAPNETFTKKESREYTIVGTLNPAIVVNMNFAKAVTWLDKGNLAPGQEYTAYIKLKSVGNAIERIKKMAVSAGLTGLDGENSPIQFNDSVLRLYAQGVSVTFNAYYITVMSVILALVIISTIAVIFNAFNISVVERVSQFGLLRCVGATPKQIRNIVFREALVLGAIGIPIGILCGIGAMGVVFSVVSALAVNLMRGGLRLIVSPWLVIASAAVGALTIYISALLPARKAGRISPMEAVRGTGIFKKEKFRKTDRHRVVLRILGAEGWMAWKNLGRNRRRFYITVFSMVISIVLFIVFNSLVQYAYHSGAVETGDIPNYLIYPKNNKAELDIGELADAASIDGVDYMLAFSDTHADAVIDPKKLNPRAAKLLENRSETDSSGNRVLVNSNIVCYRDDQLDTLVRILNLGSLDREAFLRGDGVILINAGSLVDHSAQKVVLTDITTLKPGDSLQVTSNFTNNEDKKITRSLNVLSVAGQGPAGYARNENGGVCMIVSEKLFQELAPSVPFPQRLMIMMKPGSDHTAVKARIDDYMSLNPNYNLADLDEAAQSMKQVMTIIGIFLYGFVAVISLIGCLNIINTISTNIIIRTHELSVMRAVGMNDGSLKKMVAFESILHGAAAALIGSVVGTALSWLVYNSMVQVREFAWELPWQQILIAVAAAALVAVVSGFVPLKRINKGVIMEGIRGEE